jgi:hypothetical protein
MDQDTARELQRENRDIRHQQGQHVRGYTNPYRTSRYDDRYDDEEYIQLRDGSYSRVRE